MPLDHPVLPKQAALALALLALGCEPRGPLFGTGRPRHATDVFVVGNGAEPETIDPTLVFDSDGIELCRNLFEGLVGYDSATLAPVPGVASSWEISDGGRRYLFHLRPEARWSDGVPVRAADFVYGWRRLLDPKTGADYANYLWFLENGKELNTGQNQDWDKLGVRALDDRTLEVRLRYPVAFFLQIAQFPSLSPLREDIVRRWGDRWTLPGHLVSNGPFELQDWRFRYQLTLRKNPYYWGKGRVKLDRVEVVTENDDHAMVRLYRGGEVDDTGPNNEIPQEYLAFLRDKPDLRHEAYLGTYFLWFNTRHKPFEDARVRRAFDLALDKRAICDYVLRGGQAPADHLVPDMDGPPADYHGPHGEGHDPALARRLLAEAGFPGGRGFPPVTYVYNTLEEHRQIAEALQAMWQKELGIQVTLENQEWKIAIESTRLGHFDIARFGWIADYVEPYTFLSLLLSNSETNKTGWGDPAYDALVEAALREPTLAARNRRYAEAEALLDRELPLLPLYFYTRQFLAEPYVRGLSPNLLDIHPWRDVSIAP